MKKTKRHIAFLLTVYFWGASQPILPLMDYAINFDFIVKNICVQKDEIENMCMGSCYLTEQLKQKLLEAQDNTAKKENTVSFQMLSFHFVEDKPEASKSLNNVRYFKHQTRSIDSHSSKPLLQPPQVV